MSTSVLAVLTSKATKLQSELAELLESVVTRNFLAVSFLETVRSEAIRSYRPWGEVLMREWMATASQILRQLDAQIDCTCGLFNVQRNKFSESSQQFSDVLYADIITM